MKQKGQSLVELLIAVAVFFIVVSGLSVFILDSYVFSLSSEESVLAGFLAKEALEAVRSLRDYSWDSIPAGTYRLMMNENSNWILETGEESVADQLREGVRRVIIEDLDDQTKKITSLISWKGLNNNERSFHLTTHLTTWREAVGGEGVCKGTAVACGDIYDSITCSRQDICSWVLFVCSGSCAPCSSFDKTTCSSQAGCSWSNPAKVCQGTCLACNNTNFPTYSLCVAQSGCSASPEYCAGDALSCSSYSNYDECMSQMGCYYE